MSEHAMQEMIGLSMDKIHEMADANTIFGKPIDVGSGTSLIPVSKVTLGFASGGSEFGGKGKPDAVTAGKYKGGSGAGVNIVPIAILVVNNGDVRLLPVGAPASTTLDRAVDMVPDVLNKVQAFLDKRKADKETKEQSKAPSGSVNA